jgi:histidinol-phosphate aminotransferase
MERRTARGDDGTIQYAVNGDNWHAPGAFGLYPPLELQRRLERELGALDGIDAERVVSVAGGIYAAFDLICQAFGLHGGQAILVGPVYGGIAKVLMLRGISPCFIPAGDAAPAVCENVRSRSCASTRLVVLTHPALYTAADLSMLALALAQSAPRGGLLVIDECYTAYLSAVNLVRSEHLHERAGPIVIGMRGLSKLHGLAALRLAYTVSDSAVAARLRSASVVKGIATPVLSAALDGLSGFCLQAALRRERALRRRLLACARSLGLAAEGEGPYVVIKCPDLLYQRALSSLRAQGIYVNPCTAPALVYQPGGADRDDAFQRALRQVDWN